MIIKMFFSYPEKMIKFIRMYSKIWYFLCVLAAMYSGEYDVCDVTLSVRGVGTRGA
jgi:hypothetical protein